VRPVLLVTLLAANAIDATGTLRLVRLGGEELNPVMAALLSASPALFIAAKGAVSGLIAFVCIRAPAWSLPVVAAPYFAIAAAHWWFA
jgi:membrane associated rhomboid family serine protease